MATTTCSETRLVTFRDGFTADLTVVSRLLDLEARGARFIMQDDGRIRVDPPGTLDPETRDFLRAHLDEVRKILEYQANDSHLRS